MGIIIQNGIVYSGNAERGYREHTLWQGSETPTISGTDITLADDIANYDEIVFCMISESDRKSQESFFVSELVIGETYLEETYSPESIGVFWVYTSGTSIKIYRISSLSGNAITYTKIIGIKYSEVVAGTSFHKYSTTERVVGEWIDGSTLYEKTYSYSISSETSQEITTLDSNIVVKEIRGIIHNNGNDMTIPWVDASFFYNIYSTSAHKLAAIKKNTGDWTGQAVEVTIRYTKSS